MNRPRIWNFLRQTIPTIATAVTVVLVHAYSRRSPMPPVSRPEQLMHRIVPSIVLIDLPLDEALRRLSEQSGIVIDPDWSALNGEVARDVRVNLALNDVSTACALDQLSWQLTLPLVWHHQDDKIIVTTPDGVTKASLGTLRVYDVEKLVDSAEELGSLFRPPAWHNSIATPSSRAAAAESVLDMIQWVDSESWYDLLGASGRAACALDRLVVYQTDEHHVALRQFLDLLFRWEAVR